MKGQMTIFDFLPLDDFPDDKDMVMDECEIIKLKNYVSSGEIYKIIDNHYKKGGDPTRVVEKVKNIFMQQLGKTESIIYKGQDIGMMEICPGGIFFDFFRYGIKRLLPWSYVVSQYVYIWLRKAK